MAWIVLGLAGGLIASASFYEPRVERTVQTFAAGVVGSLLGGLVAVAVGVASIDRFYEPAGWLVAMSGALLVVVAYSSVAARSSRDRGGEGRG